MQYQENGWVGIVFTLLCLVFVMLNIYRAKTEKNPQKYEKFLVLVP